MRKRGRSWLPEYHLEPLVMQFYALSRLVYHQPTFPYIQSTTIQRRPPCPQPDPVSVHAVPARVVCCDLQGTGDEFPFGVGGRSRFELPGSVKGRHCRSRLPYRGQYV